VRCAIQFETAAELQSFVSKWILKFGQGRKIVKQIGRFTSIQNETLKVFDILGQYFRKATRTTNAHNNEETDFKDVSPSSLNDEPLKLFEIHRIRNRLDPNLVEVPGGYRDLSFKLQIGFVR